MRVPVMRLLRWVVSIGGFEGKLWVDLLDAELFEALLHQFVETAVELGHQLVARLHHGNFFLRVELFHVSGHLYTNGSTAHNHDGLGFLDVCLVSLEI